MLRGLTIFLGAALVCGLGFGAGWFINDRYHFRAAHDLYQSQIRAAEGRLQDYRQKNRELETDLRDQTELVVELESRISSLELTEAPEDPAIRGPEKGGTFNVRAYLGTSYLGDADLMFTRARQTTDSKGNPRIVQEPVVRLPERFRSFFTTVTTNIIEKEVIREVPTNNSTTIVDNREVYNGLWGFGIPQVIHTVTPLDNPGPRNAGFNGNPRIINDELRKPRVRNGVVVPPPSANGPAVDRNGLIQQPLMTPAASIRTDRP